MNSPWFRIDLYNRVSSNVIQDWQMDENAFANFARCSSEHLSIINTGCFKLIAMIKYIPHLEI